MTTNQITAAIRRKVLETTDEIVSDSTVLLYANEAYKEVYKRVFTTNQIQSATLTCAAGVCTLPSGFGRVYGKAEDTAGNFYTEYPIADFERDDFNYGFTIEGGELKTLPTDITSLDIKYYVGPAEMTTTVNPTEIDDYFHEVIMYGGIARVHEDLQDEDLSTFYANKAETELQRRISNQSSYEEINQQGGEMFSRQTLI